MKDQAQTYEGRLKHAAGILPGYDFGSMDDQQHMHNSERFRALVADARLAPATAMTLFNRGRAVPVRESGWKAWLADPGSARWTAISQADLRHAERVFGAVVANAPPEERDATETGIG